MENFDNIPVFPLGGAILLPGGNLPLNIFEPRYIEMVDYALKNKKIIGMIQPNNNEKGLYNIGCTGKITSYNETNDNRYLINLQGVKRFTLGQEKKQAHKFKIFDVHYHNLNSNYKLFNEDTFDRAVFINKLKLFFTKDGIDLDFNTISKLDSITLIIMISMISPFNINEKQSLLEANTISELLDTLETLIDFSINDDSKNETVN